VARILIVEDEVRIASFIAKGLAADGYTTTTATDGHTGLDLALSGDCRAWTATRCSTRCAPPGAGCR
jgi:DNA-binding response OmpR family regulator